ncbi:MAG: glycosyltransferase family 2 protein [Coriobacteriia bacterium]|nr:glycosyltransferase family 2 protein [Coriobacteriia bacterium]
MAIDQTGKPLVSVMIPTYNRAHTIRRAVDSALAQTYRNIEILITDDGSEDDTLDILSEYNDSRIKIVRHQTNKGITSARNTCFNNASGEWLCFLSSDDELLPSAVETLINIATVIDPEADWIQCHMCDFKTGQNACGDAESGRMELGFMPSGKQQTNESWYMISREGLGADRFVEGLNTFESEWQIRVIPRLTRYFLNETLYIYHTENEDRVSLSYEKGTNAMSYYEQYARLLDANPNYVRNRIKAGIGGSFQAVISLLELNDDYQRAQTQYDIGIECGLKPEELRPPMVQDGPVHKVTMVAKRLIVKVLRAFHLKKKAPLE